MTMKNDVENYIERRKRTDKTFAKDFETGYAEFKIGLMLREAREQAGEEAREENGEFAEGRGTEDDRTEGCSAENGGSSDGADAAATEDLQGGAQCWGSSAAGADRGAAAC